MDAHFPIFWRIRQPAAAPHTMPTNTYLCSTSGVWSWSCHRAFFLAFFHNFTMTRTKYPTACMPPPSADIYVVRRYTRACVGLLPPRPWPSCSILLYKKSPTNHAEEILSTHYYGSVFSAGSSFRPSPPLIYFIGAQLCLLSWHFMFDRMMRLV